MYLKEFEVRWSDVDANRHLANSAFVNYMSHTRMGFLMEMGFNHKTMAERSLGPVVLYEHIYYFKEVFPGKPIRVSLEIVGMSEDGMFFEFYHNFYDEKGRHLAHGEMMGAWIDLQKRSLTALPTDLLETFNSFEKSGEFRTLTKEDTRAHGKFPKDLA
ncbi:acyl-CoA thioesterase [Zeaxanthinibacter enoshimensis]|uniref:Acyl-CoA thioester hydrolase n=1 Tax=Zeaxanthinibacter enoshimensis TaxID=392009 RepID=A0A4R6TSC5_9FLAO|nr:acyl-CoA thioesterase [Zeaxanthinibacter enoshimensis]TDQ33073.1 acyl-CoA thioester hydrolase [Zeaxanthinibacter enoshimensis]